MWRCEIEEGKIHLINLLPHVYTSGKKTNRCVFLKMSERGVQYTLQKKKKKKKSFLKITWLVDFSSFARLKCATEKKSFPHRMPSHGHLLSAHVKAQWFVGIYVDVQGYTIEGFPRLCEGAPICFTHDDIVRGDHHFASLWHWFMHPHMSACRHSRTYALARVLYIHEITCDDMPPHVLLHVNTFSTSCFSAIPPRWHDCSVSRSKSKYNRAGVAAAQAGAHANARECK